jgi:ubiquinone/menaquinone biosynthesis C-methylase UbiE
MGEDRVRREETVFTREQVRAIYSRTASYYDRAVRIFPLVGARVGRYRRQAVAALRLQRGATAVEMGCGTGLNFPLLHAAVGTEGRIIGVDLTGAMLDEARERVARNGWANVELVHCDMAEYEMPALVDGVISTFALTLSPDFDAVIERASATLGPEGRMVLLGLKRPPWPEPLVRFAAWLNRPFAVTVDAGERHPWESMRAHFEEVDFREYYMGAIYLSTGRGRAAS